jgi:hypothetical protein
MKVINSTPIYQKELIWFLHDKQVEDFRLQKVDFRKKAF